MFRSILTQYGNDSKQFQAFASAQIQSPMELCTMALIVLCSDSSSDMAIKDLALRVFFTHGGEPRLAYGAGDQFMDYGQRPTTSDGYMNGTLSNSSIFSPKTPLRTSTPQNGSSGGAHNGYTNGYTPQHPITPGGLDGDQSIVAGAKVINSPRHESLFTYFGRIVKDIWRRRLCAVQQTNNVYSLLTQQEVDQIGKCLNALRRAIDEHSLIVSPTLHHHPYQFQIQQQKHSGDSNLVEQERQTLQKLRAIIGVTCEVLSLWGVLLEHELHAIFVMLSPDVQKVLIQRDLCEMVRGKNDVCADLISALIRFYIGDDASTAAISERLRQLCPTLFTVDDASVVRATENIYRVKASAQPRPEMMREAVAQFRKSIQKLNLVQTCDLLLQVLYFEGIVDLVLTRARRDDPNDVGLVAYKKHISTFDGAINETIKKRKDAYNCLIEVLKLLQTMAISHGTQLATLNLGNIFPSADAIKSQLSPMQAQIERDKVIAKVLESDDELACVHVFQWMLGNNLAEQLVLSKSKYFEAFLFHEIEDGQGNAYMELLWKYYEKNQNYLEAAKVLAEMASKGTSRVSINQRITYLSNALMCIQSAPETKANAELKQDIQDKLDVAQIQLRTKALLESDTGAEAAARGREYMEQLNYQLCDLTQLYRIAKTINLHEIKLAVLHCAGKYDPEIVQNVWKDLLEKELRNFQLNRAVLESIQNNLSSILLRLRKRYVSSPQFIPLDFILRELNMLCALKSSPIHWLLEICYGAEIPYRKLLSISSEQYRLHDPFWRQNQKAFQYMLDLALCVTEKCREEATKLSSSERKLLKNTCQEFSAALELNIQERHGFAARFSDKLKQLNALIDQIV